MPYPENVVAAEEIEEAAQRLLDLSETMSDLNDDLDDVTIRLQMQIDALVSLKSKISHIRVPRNLL